ncbi:outer membrane beta-barrel protein [Flavobacterium sp.]|uniref:outer membrane beta-barrel protein n=1 Tax=Flavobacterium sp. TaxID=239 RepID=UPI003D6B82CC
MRNTIIMMFALAAFQSGYSQEAIKQDPIPAQLDEIAVKRTGKEVSIKNGNIKIDVSNSVLKKVSNPIDLLAKLPKIQVSPNKESITVLGKGTPLIYIDNQKVGMNELNSLAVEDIKSIEIINNPSSKYEAEGRAVVLITLKLSKKEGFKAIITENATFKRYFNNYFGANLSVKKNKLEVRTNFNFNQLVIWESNGNDFSIPDEDIISNYMVKAVTKRPQFVFGSGVYYKINEDDYLSFSFSGREQKDRFTIDTDTYNKEQNIENSIQTYNKNDEKRHFYNAFANYAHVSKSLEGKLFAGIQYSNFNQDIKSLVFNNYNNTAFEESQKTEQKFNITVFSGRADFEKKFKNQMKLELGTLYLEANSDTGFLTEKFNPESTTDSAYNYHEKNSTAYSQLSGNIKKMSYTGGLRVENTIAKGKFKSENGLLIDKNYTNLFPKLEIEIPIDSTKSISVRYAKSISRPNYSSTSQATAYINPYFVFANNSNLNPTLTDEVAVNFQRGEIAVNISYNKKHDPVYYGSFYDASQHLLTLKPINFKKESGFNAELVLPFSYRFWTTTNVFSTVLNKVEDETAIVKKSKPYGYWYSNNTFKLPKEITLAITFYGLTKQQEGIFERKGMFTVDAVISKTFFSHFDCTLSFADIFRKYNNYDSYTINSVIAKGKYFSDAHAVSLSIKYSFGKLKDSEFKEKNINENANRIK